MEDKKDCCKLNDLNKENQINLVFKTLKQFFSDYKPLIVVITFCILLPFFQTSYINPLIFMDLFMAYFFIFLAMFKFFDLKTFADGFSQYDLIASKVKFYAYLYPFIEAGLGLCYLAGIKLMLVYKITVAVMLVSGLGVIKSIIRGSKFKCACLGNLLNVPLSTVSILENFGMGLMALIQIVF